jgi:DNA-binding CsgD family transcriptional regulator
MSEPAGLEGGGIEALVSDLYEGLLEEPPWKSFLGGLRDALEAQATVLFVREPGRADGGGLMVSDGSRPDIDAAYTDRYFALDPLLDLPPEEVLTLADVVSTDAFLRSEFYTAFLQPAGALHVLGVDTSEPSGLTCRLRAARSPHADNFGAAERTLFEELLPHLRRALRIYSRLTRSESERDVYAGAIDQIGIGMIVLDDDGKVLQASRVAGEVLDRRDGLMLAGRELRAFLHDDTVELQRMIGRLVEARRTNTPTAVEALQIRRTQGKRNLALLARPVPSSAWPDARHSPAVVVFTGDPESTRGVPPAILQRLFGLTRAEAALAHLLAKGYSLDDASRQLGVSRNTVRVQLRALFAKTGAGRQAELVHLILQSVAPLG